MRKVKRDEGFDNSFKQHLKGKNDREIQRIVDDYAFILSLLRSDNQSIPSRYKVHKLKNKGGFFEAHLGGRGSDSLLLFRKGVEEGEPVLYLVRICTHYELDLVRAMAEDEDAVITAAYCAELLD